MLTVYFAILILGTLIILSALLREFHIHPARIAVDWLQDVFFFTNRHFQRLSFQKRIAQFNKSRAEAKTKTLPISAIDDIKSHPGQTKVERITTEIMTSLSQEASFVEKRYQERFERLEKLLKEKSELLEKTERNLEYEMMNRREFNKVKDLLEHQLIEIKNQNQRLSNDLLKISKEKGDSHLLLKLLEEKMVIQEKEILDKNEKLEAQRIQLQNFLNFGSDRMKEMIQTQSPELLNSEPNAIHANLGGPRSTSQDHPSEPSHRKPQDVFKAN